MVPAFVTGFCFYEYGRGMRSHDQLARSRRDTTNQLLCKHFPLGFIVGFVPVECNYGPVGSMCVLWCTGGCEYEAVPHHPAICTPVVHTHAVALVSIVLK